MNTEEKLVSYKCVPLRQIKETWFDHTDIANIYSFAKIAIEYLTEYNRKSNHFEVETLDGGMIFKKNSNDLY